MSKRGTNRCPQRPRDLQTIIVPTEPESDENQENLQFNHQMQMNSPITSTYKYITNIGQSKYGKAVKATKRNYLKTEYYFIKTVRRIFCSYGKTSRFLREIRLLRLLSSHENIIELVDLVPPSSALKFDSLCVVYEHMPTNLKHILRSSQYLSNLQIEYIMYQILLGVQYIHSAGIIHLNLKPQNILINDHCQIRISDFHSAHTVSEYAEKVKKRNEYRHNAFDWDMPKNAMTTPLRLPQLVRLDANRAPHMHHMIEGQHAPAAILSNREKQHLYAMDMWNVGCIFSELLQINSTNCTDYKKRYVLFQSCLHNLRPSESNDVTKLFPDTNATGIALLSEMLEVDPQKRIDVGKALRSEYFDHVRDTDAECKAYICGRIPFVQAWMRLNITHCPSQSYRDVCQVISEYVECDTLKYCADIRDPVHKDQLRDLILKEIIYLNPQWKKKLMRKLHGCACF
eukprot:845280_1